MKVLLRNVKSFQTVGNNRMRGLLDYYKSKCDKEVINRKIQIYIIDNNRLCYFC